MRAVADAGPLIALGKLGALPLLLRLYGEVMIPPAVHEEVVANGHRAGEPDAYATEFLTERGAFRVQSAPVDDVRTWEASGVDIGEAEAITLAKEQGADWLLVDNLHARHAAKGVDLAIKGTVGVIVQAFRQNHLTLLEAELLLTLIRVRGDLWISDAVCAHALQQIAGPAPQH